MPRFRASLTSPGLCGTMLAAVAAAMLAAPALADEPAKPAEPNAAPAPATAMPTPAAPAPTPAAPAAAAPSASAPAAPVSRMPDTKVMMPEEAVAVLGHDVDEAGGKNIGRLVDILVGPDGRPRAAVLDVGGFLGVGNRVVSVEWSALHFAPADSAHPITTTLTPDQIRNAPEYKESGRPAAVVVTPAKPVTTQP